MSTEPRFSTLIKEASQARLAEVAAYLRMVCDRLEEMGHAMHDLESLRECADALEARNVTELECKLKQPYLSVIPDAVESGVPSLGNSACNQIKQG